MRLMQSEEEHDQGFARATFGSYFSPGDFGNYDKRFTGEGSDVWQSSMAGTCQHMERMFDDMEKHPEDSLK
ncbi:MAG: hypothetical protein QF685_08930 [Verrucomicrobiota bacterium]|nr:hypothetical protein [Verrucomicrobiota bacterium]